MGGKTKQSQRTKNNVRPSSSSRSAELLSNAVSLDGGLVSLGGGKMVPALFPSLVANNLDQGLTPEFQMSIKKLNKKDPITRTKALQELCELVNSSDVEDVVAILPSWAHNYKTLTTDTHRKVREMTQLCHSCIVKVCGRRVAPHLKSLVPAWLQAQYDEHVPAHTHANLSLTSTFPDNKLPEVIAFCKVEVMAHLLDNLIGKAEALINKRIEDVEERQQQWSRVVSSSLQGLQYVLQRLPREHDAWLWEQLATLRATNAFWKFAAHSDALVRAAWYGAVGRLVERFPSEFGREYGAKTLRVMLNAREQNALVAAQLWASALLLMHHVQDWHTYLDKKELLIKRILDVLEAGGWGDAKHLLNLLLPILANLPQEMKTKQFYESFFIAMFLGLNKKSILNSKSERQYWITSLAECLRYLSVQETDFVVEVATSVHRKWLENILNTVHDNQTRTNLIKTSSTNMASLIKYWLKQSKVENAEKYDQLIRNFWQNVGATVLVQVDKCSTDSDEIGKLIDGHILLLQSLKTSFLQETKKQQSIKFDDDEIAKDQESVAVISQCDESILERYKHNLEDVVHKICAHYFETAVKKQVSSAVLTPLITLLVEFDSVGLFMAIARQFGVDSVYKLYDKVLRTWLSGDTMRGKAVVDIVFAAMKYMSEDEKDAMFKSFDQFPPAVVEWCMSSAARHPLVCEASVQRWLSGALCGATAGALAARGARGEPHAARLLLLCLCDAPRGGCLLSAEGVWGVVRTVTEALRGAEGGGEAGAVLAARLLTSLVDQPQHCGALLQALFRLTVAVPRGDPRLSLETWVESRGSWQDGVCALAPPLRLQFRTEAASFLHQQLDDTIEELNITRIEHIASVCPYLFDLQNDDSTTDIVSFTKLLFDLNNMESQTVETAVLRHLCVTSQLNCLYASDDVIKRVIDESGDSNIKELTKMDLLQYVNKVLFRAIYLRTLLLHKSCEEDDSSWCELLATDEYLMEELCKVIYNNVVVQTLHEAYGFWPHYSIIEETKQKLECVVESILSSMSADIHSLLRSSLLKLSERGHVHALAYHYYLNSQGNTHDSDINVDFKDSANGYFHSFQAASKYNNKSYEAALLVMVRSWYTSCKELQLPQLQELQLQEGQSRACLDVIVDTYYKHNDTMLYEMDISSSPWSRVVSNVAVVECLTEAVTHEGWEISATQWDFITITLCSLITSVHKSQKNWGSTKVSMLTRSVVCLFRAVRTFVASIRSESERRQPSTHVSDLVNEWNDIFAPDIHYNLFTFILHVLDTCGPAMSSNEVQVVEELSKCCEHLTWDLLPNTHKLGELTSDKVSSVAGSVLRQVSAPAHKYLAYHLLLAMAKPMVLEDASRLVVWSEQPGAGGGGGEDEERAPPALSLQLFHEHFLDLYDILDCALTEEHCEIAAESDSYSVGVGFLLLSEVLQQLCQLARGDLTHHYLQYFREQKYGEYQIQVALRLLPSDVYLYALDSTNTTPKPNAEHMFVDMPELTTRQGACYHVLGALGCRGAYIAVAGAGGGAARGWWGALPGRRARLLERVVAAYVTPRAVRLQLELLHARAKEVEDTEIRISWSSQEVWCVYQLEERALELRVSLSRSHPLHPPRLAAPPPAAPTHWLTLYLAYQNGTILNALKMWTASVSARVSAAPQCYICYCRMHPASGRLPAVCCHQCNNKFHNTCLRKWFTTSNKSNCPLCRANF